jgi:thiol reductant ABC exporter CydC subunit
MTLAVLAGAGAVGSAVALLATSAWLISKAAQQPPVLTLTVAIVAVRALAISRGVLRYAERLAGHDVALRMLTTLRVRVFARLEQLAPAGLPAFRRGDLLTRLVSDVDAVQDVLVRLVLPVSAAALVGIGAIGLLGWLTPGAAIALLLGLLVAGVVAPWLGARLAARSESTIAPLRGDLSAQAVELLTGAEDLVALGAADERLARLDQVDDRIRVATTRSAAAAGTGAALGQLAAGATVLACLVLGVLAVRSGSLAGVSLAVVVLTPMATFEAVAALPGAAAGASRLSTSAARVGEVLDAPVPVAEPVAPRPLRRTGGTYQPHLVLRDVSARWPGRDEVALHDVSLDLPAGRRLAVVGRSGSGKSTLAAVLLRFLEPSAGVVELDGVDVRDFTGDDVRRVVGLCAQDAYLFDSTVEANLRLAKTDATTDELRDALRRVGLLGWLDALPDGLQTRVGEAGALVSGGERQRIALARVLLADFPVVVLDEPAEHLDPEAAGSLTADLLAALAGRTVVLVTHLPYGLDIVDEVLSLDVVDAPAVLR